MEEYLKDSLIRGRAHLARHARWIEERSVLRSFFSWLTARRPESSDFSALRSPGEPRTHRPE